MPAWYRSLWRHSLGAAITASILATRLGMKNPEELFVAGLLHDIGKVVLYVKWPDVEKHCSKDATQAGGDRSLLEVEQELLGLSHADIGGCLANAWNLPVTLRELILYHHAPALAKEAALQTAIVHVADILVKGLACGNPGDDHVPPLSKQAWDMVGLDEKRWQNALPRHRASLPPSTITYEPLSNQDVGFFSYTTNLPQS